MGDGRFFRRRRRRPPGVYSENIRRISLDIIKAFTPFKQFNKEKWIFNDLKWKTCFLRKVRELFVNYIHKAWFWVKIRQIEDPFTQLLPFGDWSEEPQEIDFLKNRFWPFSKNISIFWSKYVQNPQKSHFPRKNLRVLTSPGVPDFKKHPFLIKTSPNPLKPTPNPLKPLIWGFGGGGWGVIIYYIPLIPLTPIGLSRALCIL